LLGLIALLRPLAVLLAFELVAVLSLETNIFL
jgi:hypothetical protein